MLLLVSTTWSLASNIGIPKDGKERHTQIDKYLSIAKSKLRMNIQESMEAARMARTLSLDFDEGKVIKANLNIAYAYQLKGMLDSSLLFLNLTLEKAKTLQNDTLQAATYHAMGTHYQYAGRSELAIENYHNALRINESLELDKERTRQLNNIGLVYRDEGEYEKGLEYLEKCLSIAKEKGLKRSEMYGYGNVGYILMKQNKWDAALERFERTLEINQVIKDTTAFCTMHYLIADVKLSQKDYAAARHFAQKALDVANDVNFSLGKIFSQKVLSDVYLHEKKYDEARKIAKECVQYIQDNSAYLYFNDILNVWYNIEYETGNYKKALEIQHQLAARKDSLTQIDTKEKIANSEYKYQLRHNEQENQLLKIKGETSKKMSILAMAIALLLSLLMLLSYFAYRRSKNYNETLEKAIEERTKELENSNRDLAQLNKELERFTFIASHDLKTPLRDIVSFVGLLERQLKPYDNKQVHEYLSFIKTGGMRLHHIINDTLEYSKLSHVEKQNQIQTINLNTLLSELQNSMSKHIQETNTEIIQSNDLPAINAPRSSIVLLFQNLLENSIKYNKSGNPTIRIYTKETRKNLSIFFEDNGIGIPEEYRDKIFTMFSRLHTKDKYEGSGLGLSICKKIVDQLNGEIHVRSEIGKGSIFEIQLPLDVVIGENGKAN